MNQEEVMNKLTAFFQFLLVIFIVLLGGCASTSTSTVTSTNALFLDNEFTKPLDFPNPEQVFLLTDKQQQWLDTTIVVRHNELPTNQIIDKILQRDFGLFDYDNSFTRTAAQTLETGQGNCLSMVIMTAAIAKHFTIPFHVQDVKTVPVWDRGGGLYLLNGHVNIALRTVPHRTNSYQFLKSPYITLDFVSQGQRRKLSKKIISERELIALYYINLSADAMVIKQYDRAYWLLRQAIAHAPSNSAAWNTLAVLYRRNDMAGLAEDVYKYAMSLDGQDMNIVSNYALLLEQQGRYQELFEYQRQVDLAQLRNPYRYFDLAELAYKDKQYSKALIYYKKAIKRAPMVDAFHFGMYRTYLSMGKKKAAIAALTIAQKHSADYKDRKRYNAKLALLRLVY